jgi:N-acetylglucosamine transport system substrate-binding protein
MKKIVLIAVSVILSVLAFMGCDKLDGKRTAQNPQLLKIGLHQAGYGREFLDQTIEAFKAKNPEIEFEVAVDPGMTDTIGYKLESNTELCDIFFGLEVILVKGWAVRGWIEPLDDLYAVEIDNGMTLEEKIIDGFKNFSKVDSRYGNHHYAIPWNDGASGIFYNVKMFQEHDIRIPTVYSNPDCISNTRSSHGTKSWVEGQEIGLTETCTYIKGLNVNDNIAADDDIYPFVWGGTIVNYWDFLTKTWWVQQIGVDAYADFLKMQSKEQFDPAVSPMEEMGTALTALDNLVFKVSANSMPDSESKDHTLAQMDFVSGRAAMMCNGPWLEYEMKNNTPEGFEMALMPTPFLQNAKKSGDGGYIPVNNTLAADYAVIPTAAQNKELAKKFLAFMCTDEMLQLYLNAAGTVRPFKFTPNTDKLTACQKSIVNIWQNSNNFYNVSETGFSVIQRANPLVSGLPYGALSVGNKTPSSYLTENYEFVLNEWDEWLKQIGG